MNREPGVSERLSEHRSGEDLIAHLQTLQAREGYLSEEGLRRLASRTGRSLVDVYAVATFYRSFSLKPRGKHLISVCTGTACHVRGAPGVREELERRLAIAPGETTSDGEFTLEAVNCLGACALGPIVVIDGVCFTNVRTTGVAALLAKARGGTAHGPGSAPHAPTSLDKRGATEGAGRPKARALKD